SHIKFVPLTFCSGNRFSIQDLLKARLVHSTDVMSKYLEALFFILVISQKKLELYLWEIKLFARYRSASYSVCLSHQRIWYYLNCLDIRFLCVVGKPVDPEDLRKIEAIVNKQIKDELDVFSKESVLSEAKRIKGLRAVFGEVYPDPVRVVSSGRRVEDLLADPENDEWSSLSSEFCGGTHITNTREAKAFALLSEEGISKGIRRVTAVTTECAFDAMNVASSLEKEVEDASKAEGSALEKKVAALKSRVDSAIMPAAKKADIRAKIALLQNEVRKAQKKIAEQNLKISVKVATEAAESAASDGKTFCIIQLDVGLDAAAVREAVSKVMEKKGMSIMVFSTDETTNKAVVCAGVPDKSDKFKQLDVTEWLTTALGPLKGRCGKGKSGLASGQGTDASQVNAALDLAASFASLKLN
ncbi:BnaUnng00940D, partial [Brassica napus]